MEAPGTSQTLVPWAGWALPRPFFVFTIISIIKKVATLPPDCTVLQTEDPSMNIYRSENRNLKILTL
jgi:hypothetical protein